MLIIVEHQLSLFHGGQLELSSCVLGGHGNCSAKACLEVTTDGKSQNRETLTANAFIPTCNTWSLEDQGDGSDKLEAVSKVETD